MQPTQPPDDVKQELIDELGPAAAGGVVGDVPPPGLADPEATTPAELLTATGDVGDGIPTTRPVRSPGFWRQTWRRFRRRPLSMLALLVVFLLGLVAVFSPAIAGSKPIVVSYQPLPVKDSSTGEMVEQPRQLFFPAMGYFKREWENPVFFRDGFRKQYGRKLFEKDPDAWAIWPLVFQDPYRRMQEGEWPGRPANPRHAEGEPSAMNLFGTDSSGRDVFAQMVHGTRTALLVGFVSMGIAATIGIAIGALAGYFGGWIDSLLSRFIEVVICVPTLVLILAMIAIVEKVEIYHTMSVIGLTSWTGIARLTRGEFLRLREFDFVQAARVTGVSTPGIIFRHILPNAIAPVLVPITFGIAAAILIESSLSYLGFGPPGVPSWGSLLSEGRRNVEDLWWLIVFPGAAIFLAVLCYNLIGEGLQEATDPRLRERE